MCTYCASSVQCERLVRHVGLRFTAPSLEGLGLCGECKIPAALVGAEPLRSLTIIKLSVGTDSLGDSFLFCVLVL